MKKFLSILLAVILAFSACSMVSFAEGTENTDVPADTTDIPTDINDTMYLKWVNEHLNIDVNDIELVMKEKSCINGFEDESTMYVKDGKISVEILVDLEILTFKAKLIYDTNSKKAEVYSPDLPFFYVKVNDASEYFGDFEDVLFVDFSKLVFDSAGYAEESGIEYYGEIFGNTETNMYTDCFFKDGELVRTETYNSHSDIIITEYSYEVSDKDVTLPFYAIFNVTPIFTMLGII